MRPAGPNMAYMPMRALETAPATGLRFTSDLKSTPNIRERIRTFKEVVRNFFGSAAGSLQPSPLPYS